ncbi:MAG: hypothetical protein D6698_06295 [Gammaproteobacteria bacterium]|nr:MAG: hypothetical protein D6698_06295 [Gammaproteobacteria bacterium]
MGTGRSGTTIMDILLSNNRGMTGCGEITRLFGEGVFEDDCACGREVRSCHLWSPVLERFSGQDREHLNAVIRAVERHGLFFFLAVGLRPKKLMMKYAALNQALFEALFEHGGSIVDSSKYASRALLLSELFPGRVKVLCLTRSPEGLINAFAKRGVEQPPKSLLGVALYYCYNALCFRFVISRLRGDVVKIRYEDMIADPIAVLLEIEHDLGIDLSDVRAKLINGEGLDPGHIAAGNRLRRRKNIYFKKGLKSESVQGVAKPVALLMRLIGGLLGLNPYRFRVRKRRI